MSLHIFLSSLLTWPQFFFFNGSEEQSCTNMADHRIRASITVSIVFGKHAVIRVVPTSEGCCTSSVMSKSPFKPSSPTATSSHLPSGTKLESWADEELSNLFCAWLLLFSVIIFGDLPFWASVKVWVSGFLSSLTEGQELAGFPALHIAATLLYHISLLLCQAQPHKPPPQPLLLRWLSDSPAEQCPPFN